MEELALPLAQPQVELVIHRGQPQVGLHPRHRHWHRRVRYERVVVLDLRVVAQNRVDRREVFPKTIAEYKINLKLVPKKMRFLYCFRKNNINRVPFLEPMI